MSVEADGKKRETKDGGEKMEEGWLAIWQRGLIDKAGK